MISNHFCPVVRNGMKFDAGMCLLEFDALREPEATQFPKIGDYLRGLGFEFNEVKPSMLWCGNIVPDLYIANQLDAVPLGFVESRVDLVPSNNKASWPETYTLNQASRIRNGEKFHHAFIEPMCIKISGIPSNEIIARYHRSLWLPLYWPQTLRKKESLPTKFWYPTSGYAGVIAERLGSGSQPAQWPVVAEADRVEITLSFVLAKPAKEFQVLFVVDKSPIYRVTNQDACSGVRLPLERFVVESREYCADITDELQRLGLVINVQYSSQMKIRMPLPTLANYRRGWRPAPHLNDQLLQVMRDTVS